MELTCFTPAQTAAFRRIWECIRYSDPAQAAYKASWERDLQQLFRLDIGMQEMLQYLYAKQPDLSTFIRWIEERQVPESASSSGQEVLTPEDLAHWNEKGFVVVRNAVDAVSCNAAAAAIWEFLNADPADPASWYQQHEARNGLMVLFTRHPALQAIRDSPVIRRAYEQLYGTSAIYKVVDKVSFNPPETAAYRFAGSPLHWDTSLALPIPFRLQGLLYLSPVTAEGGAFQCVPGFHHRMDTWLNSLSPGADPRREALETLQPVPVPGNAGDFIIWHQALPHCASPNHSNAPRLVQYLTYLPEQFEDHRAWI